MTDPNGRIIREGFENRAPRTAAEFAAAFLKSEHGRENRSDMEAYRLKYVEQPDLKQRYRLSAVAEHAKTQRKKSAYTISIPMQARAVALRRIQIIRGNAAIEIIQIIVFMLQSVINGTVFLQIPDNTSAYFSRGGVLFL